MPLNLDKIRQWAATNESQAAAARRLGISPQNFGRLLMGNRTDLRISTIEHLASVMGCEPGELFISQKSSPKRAL